MPCIQPDTFLSEQEIKSYLTALKEQSLSALQLSKEVKKPLFKVRSTIRELKRLEYVGGDEAALTLTEKGATYLLEA